MPQYDRGMLPTSGATGGIPPMQSKHTTGPRHIVHMPLQALPHCGWSKVAAGNLGVDFGGAKEYGEDNFKGCFTLTSNLDFAPFLVPSSGIWRPGGQCSTDGAVRHDRGACEDEVFRDNKNHENMRIFSEPPFYKIEWEQPLRTEKLLSVSDEKNRESSLFF